jgi:hypothetical protein
VCVCRGYYFEDKGKVTVSLNVMEAFKKSLQTPKLWIENLNPERTRVFWLLSSTLQVNILGALPAGNCTHRVICRYNFLI